jgi:NADH dehydrogenase [ubiquinone] 1 alpha subcomplex assembly factor 7
VTDAPPNDLARRLLRRVAASGPMTVAEFMASALYDPAGGYYTTRRPIGAAGDFVTAPEVSQLFGELIGLWCAETWERLGRPAPLRLVELGPGRGTLLADLLRAARVLPDFERALELHLVEISPELRRAQQAVLGGRSATWHASLESVPEGAFLLVANEFLDALPVRQLERAPDAWRERLVGAAGEGLGFALSGPVPLALIPAERRDAPVGSVLELCPAATALAAEIARRAAAGPGAALLVDYGYAAPPLRGTLQAVSRHRAVPPLERPGEVDLTALVDFGAVAGAARAAGAAAWGPVPQGALLGALGIAPRAQRLAARANEAQRAALASAVRRLTDPAEMGERFLALAIAPPGLGAPAGFSAAPP